MRKNYEAIIWDWNGTLLDDLVFCISCINRMLDPRGLNKLNPVTYREVFGFPVKSYYEKAGFNFHKESWDTVAMEFMNLYWDGMHSCKIFPDVNQTLHNLSEAGLKQYVLSAMEQDSLRELIDFHSLSPYFEKVAGIRDHFANGKDQMAKTLLKSLKIDASRVLMIGDTYHDFEVAKQNGMDCIFVSRGHQSVQRLLKANIPVLDSLNDVTSHVLQ